MVPENTIEQFVSNKKTQSTVTLFFDIFIPFVLFSWLLFSNTLSFGVAKSVDPCIVAPDTINENGNLYFVISLGDSANNYASIYPAPDHYTYTKGIRSGALMHVTQPVTLRILKKNKSGDDLVVAEHIVAITTPTPVPTARPTATPQPTIIPSPTSELTPTPQPKPKVSRKKAQKKITNPKARTTKISPTQIITSPDKQVTITPSANTPENTKTTTKRQELAQITVSPFTALTLIVGLLVLGACFIKASNSQFANRIMRDVIRGDDDD